MKLKLQLFVFIFLISLFNSSAQDFITIWDLSLNAGSGTDIIYFNTTIAAGDANYTWQEISPGNSSGSGTFTQRTNSPVAITGLPYHGKIRLSIVSTNLQKFAIGGFDSKRLVDVESWGSANWTSMSYAFYGCTNLNITALDVPNLSGVNNMNQMFTYCSSLNGPSNINTWNTSSVKYMQNIFGSALAFNQNIDGWNTASVLDMAGMFNNASAFNKDLNSWNTASVTNMGSMFYGATSFNGNIGGWNIGAVTNMNSMLRNATSFNQNIGSWILSSLTNMAYFLNGANTFNQYIGGWNTTTVADMTSMFKGAISFNQDISAWNTANTTNMGEMFNGASAFNQNLGSWSIYSFVSMVNMLSNCGMDCQNYSNTLIGWSNNPLTRSGRFLGSVGRKYGINSLAARTNLTSTKGWTINGDSLFNPPPIIIPANNNRISDSGCDYFLNPLNSNEKQINLIANGNTFDFDNSTATITNTFTSPLPSHVTKAISGNTGYYQTSSSSSTFRLSRRMHSIVAPGTFPINGGVLLRVYFLAEDTTFIINNPSPSVPINFWGWLKVESEDIDSIVNSMNSASPALSIPSEIVVPQAIGIENGILYAEFLAKSFSTFVYFSSTIEPLPVELIYFRATNVGTTDQLNWGTATELNNDYFEVLHSMDAQHWTSIGKELGAGNSTHPIDYHFTDSSPQKGTNYYRLKQIDFDGKSKLLPIAQATFEGPANQITFYPNPVNDVLLISGFEEVPNQISIYDALGREIKMFCGFSAQENIIQFDVSYLSSGVYMVVVNSSQGLVSSKLIK